MQASACRPLCIMPYLSLKYPLSIVAYVFLSYCLAISMDISLFIPITFIAIFIHIPCRYYWIFHCLSLPISLRFSLLFQCDIIGYFILYLWYYLCDFILIPRRYYPYTLF